MSLRESLVNNLWLKLFSLFLAMLIWFSVRFYAKEDVGLGRNPLSLFSTREFIQVPVTVIRSPNSSARCKTEPGHVDITVSGDKSILKGMSTKEIVAAVNLIDRANTGVSSNEVRIYAPPGVSVLQVLPPVVRVEHLPP